MCTGLIEAWSVSAFTTGMKMMIAGTGSMKSPTMTNTMTQTGSAVRFPVCLDSL
jgi:hypothetical protein